MNKIQINWDFLSPQSSTNSSNSRIWSSWREVCPKYLTLWEKDNTVARGEKCLSMTQLNSVTVKFAFLPKPTWALEAYRQPLQFGCVCSPEILRVNNSDNVIACCWFHEWHSTYSRSIYLRTIDLLLVSHKMYWCQHFHIFGTNIAETGHDTQKSKFISFHFSLTPSISKM